ncbi:malonyl-CoA synthase [Hallella multisaccharivorax DSM 17128]|uniref:O-succinylbenzoate--CoA ligase n=1 Tax=Hallella multisaccharivorax DSM 17128 TaxID=688246 RepID=F8N5P6_9BACT|nr:class I adenylate-forming enzyme family protein [Hallella multisaccharivorax]EGN58204.1 o-succinylbenzoate--CoA ligase [Hallella multisaccharivorax DSM 17128]GJG31702.1 malonyl-CoA synthase [Hallella multisaccharivorax DSM 17128]
MSLSKTLEEAIREHASVLPGKTAIVCENHRITYSGLWAEMCRRRDELLSGGLGHGQLHIFRALPTPDFLYTYLSVHLLGGVAVPVDKDLTDELFSALRHSLAGKALPWSAASPLENIADVLFTTGSTGAQKGVMESYRALLANADNLIQAQGYGPETIFVICGPLNHLGCLSKLWSTLMVGGTLILLDGMKDMTRFFEVLGFPGGRLAVFMVPSSIRMMLMLGRKQLSLLSENIDFIETGGATLAQKDMEELCDLLPHARLYNTYASTETGIVCTYNFNHEPYVAGCVGKPMVHSSVMIADDHTIACQGATLMSGYLDDERLTASVLRDGTLYTQDLGKIDSEGNLYMLGRNNDVINTGGYKVSPQEVENVVASFPGIMDCICLRDLSPLFGETVKLCYVVEEGATVNKRDLARFIASRLETYKVPRVFEQVDAIHHTFNGKPDRKYYAEL